MPTTPQNQTIATANNIITAAAQLKELYDLATEIAASWNDNATANALNAQSTSALNADGSLGTPNGNPDVTNPISNPALVRALSANEITAMKTVLDTFASYVNGNAIPATPGVRAILNSASG